MNGEIYDGKTFSVLNQFIRDICNKKVCDRLIKYSRKGLVKYKNAYRAYLSLDDCRDITIYEGSKLFEIIKKIQNEVAVNMGAKNVGEIYDNSKYSVVDYYRKCELRYFKEATLGKVRPLIEITLGDLNVTFSEREYRDAISTWQNYILDSVEQRLNSSIKSRDEKKEQALNGDNNLWSDDLKELFSKEEYENQKNNGELELENGTVFSVVNKEIQKIDIKYLSDEKYAEIKEILAAWKKDINSK